MKYQIAATTMLLLIGFSASATAGKDVFERTKPHVNVGTIGHVHTGKKPTTSETQFKIQLGTSDMQNAEQLESLKKKRRASNLSQD